MDSGRMMRRKRTIRFLLFVASFLNTLQFSDGQICTSGAAVVQYRPSPSASSYLPTDNYLTVCTTQVAGCDGHIAQWQFFSTSNDAATVYLSVWRSVGPASYTLVGYNAAKATKIGVNVFDVPYPEMISVRANDFIGIFYPSPGNLPVIPYLTSSTADTAVTSKLQNCVLSRHFLPTILDNIKNFGMIVGTGIRSVRQPILTAIVAKPDSCGASPAIEKAHLTTPPKVAYDVGDYVMYACGHGYALIGNNTVTCYGYGQWSSPLPTCQPKSGPGIVSPSSSMNHFNNNNNLNNNYNQQIERMCDSPPEIENGYVMFNSTRIGAVAHYTCLDEYRLAGSSTATCNENCHWSQPPQCNLRGCGSIPAIPNAQLLSGWSSEVGSNLVYKCLPGFRLTWGNGTITCGSDGRWSRLPVCQEVDCGQPPPIENGDFFGSSQTLGSTVLYRCRQGYKLTTPSDKITCQKDGSWTKPPSCQLVSCGDLPRVENAKPRESSTVEQNIVGATAIYDCYEGYRLFGNASIVCLDGGFWSPSPTCTPIDCGPPPGVSYGLAQYNSTLLASKATYKCDLGFKMRGNGVATCSEAGSWTTVPVCDAVDCDVPPAISNAVVRYETTKRGSVAVYVCRDGYQIRGPQSVTCTDSGAWTPGGSCQVVTCATLPSIQHGILVSPALQVIATMQPFQIGTQLRFACQPGFLMVTGKGNSTVACTTSGTWSELPLCVEVNCPNSLAPSPDSKVAKFVVKSTKIGAKAQAFCAENHQFAPGSPQFVTCQSDGLWSTSPICIVVDCGRPPEIANGQVAFLGSTPGSGAEYRCNAGHTMFGYAKIACLSDGNWEKPPVCAPVTCPQPDELSHGRIAFASLTFGASLSFACDYGYMLLSTNGRPYDVNQEKVVCQKDGTWTKNFPVCREVTCPQLPQVVNGQLFKIDGYRIGNSAAYRCLDGFKMNGSSVVNCQSSGQWSKPPTCEARQCAVPNSIENGRIEFTSLVVGSTAQFFCDSGFTLRGSSVLVCGADGEWNGAMPICKALQCPQPVPPPNGIITVKRYSAGSVAQVSCNPGYLLSGPPVIICQEDGIWSAGPICKPRGCPPPPQIANGRVDYGGTDFNARASYTCNTGYVLSGDPMSTCQQDGSWSGTPSCSQLSCPLPSPLANGRIDYSSLAVGATVTYYCNPNFVLSGPSFASCLQDGTWSAPPICTVPMCATPPAVTNAVLSGSTGQMPGSTASYTCVGDYQLVGSPTITCLQNGTWTDFTGMCSLPLKCPMPPPIQNGQVNYASLNVGSAATYTCQPNFVLTGSASILCQADGTWSPAPPTCGDAVRCPAPGQIAGGQVYYAALTPSSIAVYTCNAGYVLQGQQIVFCQADGTWSYPAPTCAPPTTTPLPICPPPSEISNGLLAFTGTSIGSQVTYSCNPGYTMQGAGVLVCTGSGQWSSFPPICAKVQDTTSTSTTTTVTTTSAPPQTTTTAQICPSPPQINHGVIICTGVTPGATAFAGCDTGYYLIGRKRYKCGPFGSWVPSAWPPTCTGPPDYYLPSQQVGGIGIFGGAGSLGGAIGTSGGTSFATMGNGVIPVPGGMKPTNTLPDPDMDPVNYGNYYQGNGNFPINVGLNTVAPGVPDNGNPITPPGFPSGANPYQTGPPPSCGPPPVIPNGKTNYPTAQAAFVVVSCDPGFVLVGPTIFLTCASDGLWYPPAPQQPTCTPTYNDFAIINNGSGIETRQYRSVHISAETCGDVPFVAGAVPITSWDITRRRSHAMDTVRYECAQGRQQYGSAVIVCQANGQWTSPLPICLNCKIGLDVTNDALTNVSAAAHIFTDMRVTCNGSVVAWVFYSRASAGNTVYVDIWRPIEMGSRRYQLIGSNEVVVQWSGLNAVIIAETPGRVTVQQGDVVGFHYVDSPVTPQERLVIPTATGANPGPFSPNQLSVTYSTTRSSLAPGDIIDLNLEGFRSYQLPALQALISRQ